MLAKLIEDNYKQILVCATNITRRKDRHQAKALINEAYITASSKDLTGKEEHFVKWFTKMMHFIYIDKNTKYNKGERLSEIHLEYDPGNEDWKEIELVLDTNDETIDTIINLSHLGKDKAIKYTELMQFKNSLPPHEKEIFSLHFEQGLSSRSIAKLMKFETGYEMNYVRYNEMINKVKAKIYG